MVGHRNIKKSTNLFVCRDKILFMEIKIAEFIKGIKGTDDILYDGVPQVVFVGRSNVGKSSTINCLVGRKSLVKTSAKVGKTREINFFLINNNIYFVDLPGYGFAGMSQKGSEKLNKHIAWYLRDFELKPKYTVVIIDAKVGVTDFDKQMIEILDKSCHNVIVLANKIDKLKKNDIRKKIEEFHIESGGKLVFPFSAKEKVGRVEVLGILFS